MQDIYINRGVHVVRVHIRAQGVGLGEMNGVVNFFNNHVTHRCVHSEREREDGMCRPK